MENIKNRFRTITGNSSFTRVNPEHTLDLYIGLDEKGRYSLKYRGNFSPEKIVKAVSGIEINQYRSDTFNTLMFSLTEKENCELFFIFCDYIIETVSHILDHNIAYKSTINRFYSWKKMFSTPRERLSESEIMGLIGELLFLKDFLFLHYGKTDALRSWSGQELTHKDFSYNDRWYEVKTILSGKENVKISSFEQLESLCIGELIVFFLEKMSSSFDGIKLNSLAFEILNTFDLKTDKDLFLSKISMLGFSFIEEYDELVFSFISMERYLVDSKFPKLSRNDVNQAISKAQYELRLGHLKEYIIKD